MDDWWCMITDSIKICWCQKTIVHNWWCVITISTKYLVVSQNHRVPKMVCHHHLCQACAGVGTPWCGNQTTTVFNKILVQKLYLEVSTISIPALNRFKVN